MIHAFEGAGARRKRWLLAFVCGIVVHAGAIAAALVGGMPEAETDDDSGPIAIELAPLPVAPRAQALDVPAGPRAEETQAAIMTPQKTEIAKAEEATALPSTPYEPDDPELRMARHNPELDTEAARTSEVTTERIEQSATAPSAPVPETTAPPPSTAPPDDSAAAPEAGMSQQARQIVARWQRKVVLHLNAFKRYPPEARRRKEQGDVQVTFKIDREGRIVARAVSGPSDISELGAAAIDMLDRAGPLPPPPPQIAGPTVQLSLPIQYRLKD